MIVSGLALTTVQLTGLRLADGLGWLFVGEALYGVASGLVSSGATVALRELHPPGIRQRAALGASPRATTIGLTLGPLISGGLARASTVADGEPIRLRHHAGDGTARGDGGRARDRDPPTSNLATGTWLDLPPRDPPPLLGGRGGVVHRMGDHRLGAGAQPNVPRP